jgi:surfeit locus 1 family protein
VLKREKMSFVKPDWRITVFSVGFLILFLNLGVWQWQRAAEKEEMLAAAEVRANEPGVEYSADAQFDPGEPLRANGRFQAEPILLLDNRVLNGRVGYEVLQVFAVADAPDLLVNRGFIQGGKTRSERPSIPAYYAGEQEIRGLTYLTEMTVPADNLLVGEPLVIQVVKPELLEETLGLELFPYVLRLGESHPDALPRYWPITTMSPERHMGYAITWFVMAAAIVIAFLTTVINRGQPQKEKL